MKTHNSWQNKLPQNQPRSNAKMAAHLLAHCIISESGCWEWNGQLSKSGYGKIHWRLYGHLRVHRVAMFLWRDFPLTDTRRVLHRCDNRKCFNPEHLFVGTDRDNQQDCLSKGRNYQRRKTHCKRSHEFSAENTWTDKKGARHCRTCHRDDVLASYYRRKEVETSEEAQVKLNRMPLRHSRTSTTS